MSDESTVSYTGIREILKSSLKYIIGGGIVSLTPKQEKFVQGIVSGKLSQREAYKQAYLHHKHQQDNME